MKLSKVYVVEVEKENKSRYGNYAVFATFEELQSDVENNPDAYGDKPVYVVDLNKFPRQTVKMSAVVIV